MPDKSQIGFSALLQQLHPTLNKGLQIDKLTPMSHKKVWWLCAHGHSWEAIIKNRTTGQGCPYCAGKRPTELNNLKALYPHVAKRWDDVKNQGILPENILPKISKKFWWLCKRGHSYSAAVGSQTAGCGCPYCSGRLVKEGCSLANQRPDLAAEWDVNKNLPLTPNEVSVGSDKKVHWRCPRGHSYPAIIGNRTRNNSGCPHCKGQISKAQLSLFAELKTIFFEAQLNEAIQIYTCDILIKKYNIVIELDGRVWHQNRHDNDVEKNLFLKKRGIQVYRIREMGLEKVNENTDVYLSDYTDISLHRAIKDLLRLLLQNTELHSEDVDKIESYLSKDCLANEAEAKRLIASLPNPQQEKSLASVYPELCKEWHNEKNEAMLPQAFTPGSGKKVWWQCSTKKSHEWQATILSRTQGSGCPYCSNHRADAENNVAIKNPEIAKEWDYEKNKNLNPLSVTTGSSKHAWWRCSTCSNSWKTSIRNRTTHKSNCPKCSGEKGRIKRIENASFGKNSLKEYSPKIAAEWHPTKNTLTLDQVSYGSNQRAHWICNAGHEWEARINDRTRGSGCCPYCRGKKTTMGNSLSDLFPHIATEWHLEKNGQLLPSAFRPGSDKKVWWHCPKGHEFLASIYSRTKKETGCPYCCNKKADDQSALSVTHQHIAKDWHPEKNGALLASQVVAGSGKKVWWQCKQLHEQQIEIRWRVKHNGCSKCQ